MPDHVPATSYTDLNPSPRILLGPGPSMVHPRVLRAMSAPLTGHLDPQFIDIMNEVQDLLRLVLQRLLDLVDLDHDGSDPADDAVVSAADDEFEKPLDHGKKEGWGRSPGS